MIRHTNKFLNKSLYAQYRKSIKLDINLLINSLCSPMPSLNISSKEESIVLCTPGSEALKAGLPNAIDLEVTNSDSEPPEIGFMICNGKNCHNLPSAVCCNSSLIENTIRDTFTVPIYSHGLSNALIGKPNPKNKILSKFE